MSLDSLLAQHNAAFNTPKHIFNIPQKLLQEFGIKSVTLRELVGNDEVNAHTAAGASGAKLAFELVKLSLIRIEYVARGAVEVNAHNADVEFGTLPPKIRNLVLAAYQHVHNPAQDDIDDFLGSRKVQVQD